MKAVTLMVAFAVAIAIAVATPADAARKKGKRMVAAPKDPNENSWRFVRDAMPVFIPGGGLIAAEQAKSKKPVRRARAS